MPTIRLYGRFTLDKVGVDSLTVTAVLKRISRSAGTYAELDDDAACVGIGEGWYHVAIADADVAANDYGAVFSCSDAALVDDNAVSAISQAVFAYDTQLVMLDAAISTRSSAAALATAQADLDDPAQYMADVSALATAANLATVDGNVDSVLVDTGTTIPGLINALNDATPTQVAALVYAMIQALVDVEIPTSTLTQYIGDTWAVPLEGIDLSDMDDMILTIKGSLDDADSGAVVQVRKTGGLIVFQGAGPASALAGTLTKTDDTAALLTLTAAYSTQLAANRQAVWSLKKVAGSTWTTMREGIWAIKAAATRATS